MVHEKGKPDAASLGPFEHLQVDGGDTNDIGPGRLHDGRCLCVLIGTATITGDRLLLRTAPTEGVGADVSLLSDV